MGRARALRLVIAATIGIIAGLAGGNAGSPAFAVIRDLSPSSLTLVAGDSGAVTVHILSRQESCLSATTTAPDIHFSIVGAECGTDRVVDLVVHTSTGTPPGIATVEVRDRHSVRTFTVTVEAAPPATTTSTSTSSTTTLFPPPSAAASTTTSPPPAGMATSTTNASTRAPATPIVEVPSGAGLPANAPLGGGSTPSSADRGSPSSSSAPSDPQGSSASPAPSGEVAFPSPVSGASPGTTAEGFLSVAALVQKGSPERGLFLPFAIGAYPDCVPPVASCTDDRSDLVLVSAAAADIVWAAAERRPSGHEPSSEAFEGLDVALVGSPAPEVAGLDSDPSTASFVLSVLDLRASPARVRRVERSLDERGRLTGPGGLSEVLAPSVVGPPLTRPERPESAAGWLGRPRVATADRFVQRSPVFVVSTAGARFELLYGLLPAADAGVIPLLGVSHVAHFVTDVAGAKGLFVPQGSTPPAGAGTTNGGVDRGPADLLLLAVVAVVVGLELWLTLRARRPRAAE